MRDIIWGGIKSLVINGRHRRGHWSDYILMAIGIGLYLGLALYAADRLMGGFVAWVQGKGWLG